MTARKPEDEAAIRERMEEILREQLERVQPAIPLAPKRRRKK